MSAVDSSPEDQNMYSVLGGDLQAGIICSSSARSQRIRNDVDKGSQQGDDVRV